VVVFDEIAHGRWIDRELLGTLNDFMETGRFTRGAQQFTAQTSLVFLGNTDDPTVPQTQFLPGSLTREAGFFDRLSALIPGHEMPKIHGELLDVDRGLAVDYLAEILRMLRTRVVPVSVGTKVPSEFTERDVRAVQKLVSAFAKLLYPGGDWPEDRIAVWTDFAIELREQVNKELSFLNPIEFPPRRVSSSSLAASPETEADQRTEETVTE
jgi:ATP-dependent Lon protease